MNLNEEKLRLVIREAIGKALGEQTNTDTTEETVAENEETAVEENEEIEEGAKPDFLDLDKDGDTEESMEDAAADAKNETLNENDGIAMSIDGIFAPNHYCVHHGGINVDGAVKEGKVIGHNWNEELQKVTAYDMELTDGTIVEGVPAESILVTEASLAEGHGAHMAKRDGEKTDDDDKKKEDEEELGAQIAGANSGVNEEEEIQKEQEDTEETLKEWYDGSLYGKLLKEYTKKR